jgi:hypothetical protein
MKNATSNMTLGQFSEAFFILLIPFFFRRLGVKWMIALGMIAWGVRFLFFGSEMQKKDSGCYLPVSFCTVSVLISSL